MPHRTLHAQSGKQPVQCSILYDREFYKPTIRCFLMTTVENQRLHTRKVHAYAASFSDTLASQLLTSYSSHGDLCLDPFVGASTTLIQCRLLARPAIGIDIDPIACLIARVLITRCSNEYLDMLQRTLSDKLNLAKLALSKIKIHPDALLPGTRCSLDQFDLKIPPNDNIGFWFSPIQRAVLSALVSIATSLDNDLSRDITKLAISSSIVRKWPNTISLARDIDHSRPHKVMKESATLESEMRIFESSFRSVCRTIKKLNELSPDYSGNITILHGDASKIIPTIGGRVAYVLTSPPYFNAIDYPRAHKFSHWWLFPDDVPLTRQLYVGLRSPDHNESYLNDCRAAVPRTYERVIPLQSVSKSLFASLCQYILDMNSVIRQISRILIPGKCVSFVLANNKIHGLGIPIVDLVSELLSANNFTSTHITERPLAPERRRYPFGIHGFKGLMETEYVITAKLGLSHHTTPS